MEGIFCAYSIILLIVHHIERYNSEKAFGGNEMHGWLKEALLAIHRFPEATYV